MPNLPTIFNTKVPVHLTLHNCLEPNQNTEPSPILREHHNLQRTFWEATDWSQIKSAHEKKPMDHPAQSLNRQTCPCSIPASTSPSLHVGQKEISMITQIKTTVKLVNWPHQTKKNNCTQYEPALGLHFKTFGWRLERKAWSSTLSSLWQAAERVLFDRSGVWTGPQTNLEHK